MKFVCYRFGGVVDEVPWSRILMRICTDAPVSLSCSGGIGISRDEIVRVQSLP